MVKSEHKSSILTHSERLRARKIRLRWLIALSSLPLFGMVTAFGLAPQTDTAQIPLQTVVENLSLPDSLIQTNPEHIAHYWRDEHMERGDTAASVLQRLGVNNDQIALFLKSPEATHALIKIKSGQRIQAEVTDTGNLVWLRHIGVDGTMLQIDAAADTFKASQQTARSSVLPTSHK